MFIVHSLTILKSFELTNAFLVSQTDHDNKEKKKKKDFFKSLGTRA
jgi:hypothetical protein